MVRALPIHFGQYESNNKKRHLFDESQLLMVLDLNKLEPSNQFSIHIVIEVTGMKRLCEIVISQGS